MNLRSLSTHVASTWFRDLRVFGVDHDAALVAIGWLDRARPADRATKAFAWGLRNPHDDGDDWAMADERFTETWADRRARRALTNDARLRAVADAILDTLAPSPFECVGEIVVKAAPIATTIMLPPAKMKKSRVRRAAEKQLNALCA